MTVIGLMVTTISCAKNPLKDHAAMCQGVPMPVQDWTLVNGMVHIEDESVSVYLPANACVFVKMKTP